MTLHIDFGVLEKPKSDASVIQKHIDGIEKRNQGFYKVICEPDLPTDIKEYAETVEGKYDFIVVLGIGGSALGTQTLRDTLCDKKQKDRLIIVDNIDPDLIAEVEETIEGKNTLFVVVTKSGGTPETLSLYSYFRKKVESEGKKVQDHFVFITDPENGYLREVANAENITSFEVPQDVGGRFSVLTAVGLLPAALVGIDIDDLLAGAQNMTDVFMSVEDNFVHQIAQLQYMQMDAGRSNLVMMPYSQRLKTFGDWYAQLLAESTGKINGSGENTGLSPVSSLGVTDQHSQLQLYTQGRDDKQFCMIKVEKFQHRKNIPDMGDHEKVAMLEGVDFGTLMQTEMKGTIGTLQELERPVYTIVVPEVDAFTLGEMILLFEGATAFLGEMLDINAFDQPGVERSKILTRKYLS